MTISLHDPERRRAPRVETRQFGKLSHERSGKFMACVAVNISDTGAMIESRRPLPFSPGERFRMALSAGASPMVLRMVDMFEVEAVRCLPAANGSFAMAVRFVDAARQRLAG